MNIPFRPDSPDSPIINVAGLEADGAAPPRQPTWMAALTLPERLTLAQRAPGGMENLPTDKQLGLGRLQRWKSEAAFRSEPALFRDRLAADGLTEKEFLHLLGIPPAVGAELQQEPRWWSDFTDRWLSNGVIASPAPPADSSAGEFQVALLPLVVAARARLSERLSRELPHDQKTPLAPGNVDAVDFCGLTTQLSVMTTRAFVVELHAARLEGRLKGDTSADRFASFLRQLADPRVVQSILFEYPVLVRQLGIALDQWVDATHELLARLYRDWPLICSTFSPQADPGPLIKLEGQTGDLHNRGRSVHRLTFASGLRLIYKPRSLAVDVHFQQLLAWVNTRGTRWPFRTLAVLNRSSYGWMEFVEAAGCTSRDEVQRFYKRQGGYLALLYALNATDFHNENLIAAGEQPILIDLESLFHPILDQPAASGVEAVALRALADSVVRTGFLPYRLWANDESEGLEMSGLGGAADQLTPEPVHTWEERGLDSMRIVRKRVNLPAQANRPNLNGADVNPYDYVEHIFDGFQSVYRLLWSRRDELLAPSGPLHAFAGDCVRCIVRPTWTYGTLLWEGFHPQLLRDALSRERLFDHLWLGTVQNPSLRRFIPYEREDLHHGDVPVFTTQPEALVVWSSQGKAISDAVRESGMDVASRRLQRMGEQDLAHQVWFVRASLAALDNGEGGSVRPARPASHAARPTQKLPADRFFDCARRAGDRIVELALMDDQDAVGWLGLSVVKWRTWGIAPARHDLYDGLAGIGMFLGYLGMLTGEDRYRDLSRRVVKAVERDLEREVRPEEKLPIGAFGPLGSSLYFLCHAAAFTKDADLLLKGEKILDRIAPRIDADDQYDIIAGAAGCIACLLVYHRCRPNERALRLARQCGEHLLSHAEPAPPGHGWRTPNDSFPLTGFAHGAAGIGWALLELAAATADERFREAARGAFAYERSLYSAEVHNWPDLRQDPQSATGNHARRTSMTAWCHGAPGVGLSRVLALPHLDDPELDHEIRAAVGTTLAQTFGLNHSLCHGALGNLDFLVQAATASRKRRGLAEQWKDSGEHGTAAPLIGEDVSLEIDRLAAQVLEEIERHGWSCGTPCDVDTPGLMLGLAGIGHGLLRIAAPAQVPSVLALAQPCEREPDGSQGHQPVDVRG